MRTAIVTVGTSLLSNAQRSLQKADISDEEVIHYLRTTPAKQATAETNSLSCLPLQSDDRLNFVYSQTPEDERCAQFLARHYERDGYDVDVVEVQDLTY